MLKHLTPTHAYIISFVLLAMWAIFSYATMQNQIKQQERYAELINISGKQRMLSQRTALLAGQYLQTSDLSLLEELKRHRSLMEKDHRYLTDNLPSEDLRKIYYEKPYSLNFKANEYFDLLEAFVVNSGSFDSDYILEYSSRLLPDLDYAVKVYEQESDNKNDQLMKIEGYILLGTILTLILEALLILRPTIKKASLNMEQLEAMAQDKTRALVQSLEELRVEIAARKQAETERSELDAQLRQKYKMDSVGVMAGGMAHNFNNNLSIILGNVELAKMKMPINPEIEGYLSNAKIAVLRSRDLIQQIMNYSRQGLQEKKPTQLPLVVDETLLLMRSTIPTTINLHKNISSDSFTCTVSADVSQIQECLINLCNNAMHAMEEKGTLSICLETVELQQEDIPALYESQPGLFAKLSVQDNGSGMSAETLDKVFDLFYTTKPVGEGTGVGLSTVQGIVTQHGGLIKVNSRQGEGTTFDLYFPVLDQSPVSEITSVCNDLPEGTELILFVDDDPMLTSLGEHILKTKGYTVSTMSDSTEALKLFAANADRFDLVITDQTMPDLCGQDLIHEIRKIRADIPTIICTGFSSKIDEDKAKALGISAFLMKPLDVSKLLQTVRWVLDGE
jgi:signal transduction histidine kinase